MSETMDWCSAEEAAALRQRWEASPRLRAEFGGRFEACCAFTRAVVAAYLHRNDVKVTLWTPLPPELAGIFPNAVRVAAPPQGNR